MKQNKNPDASERPLDLIVRLLVEKDGHLYECQTVPQGYKCGKCMTGLIIGGWQPKCRVCGAKVQPNGQLHGPRPQAEGPCGSES